MHLSLFLNSRQSHFENRNRFDGIPPACDEAKDESRVSHLHGLGAGASYMNDAAKAVEQLPSINP